MSQQRIGWGRAIVFAVSIAAALPALAVGLGTAQVRSYLNEPLHVQIPVTGLRPGELDSLRVRLADEAAFARAGFERDSLPPSLRLELRPRGRNAEVIIRSRQSVREPGIRLVVELSGPRGVAHRSYQLLIDYR